MGELTQERTQNVLHDATVAIIISLAGRIYAHSRTEFLIACADY